MMEETPQPTPSKKALQSLPPLEGSSPTHASSVSAPLSNPSLPQSNPLPPRGKTPSPEVPDLSVGYRDGHASPHSGANGAGTPAEEQAVAGAENEASVPSGHAEGGGGAGGKERKEGKERDRRASRARRSSTYHYVDVSTGKLPWRTKLLYGAPGFATTSLSFLISVYALDFYVSIGANLAFLSFFTALARSFDVLTDPFMGWYSDKARTAYGRRRPFMFAGTWVYCVLFTLLFWPFFGAGNDGNKTFDFKDGDEEPESSGPSSMAISIWFGFFYTAFYFADTFSNVPYEALGPELTDDYEERNTLFLTAKLFNFVGMLCAAGAPAALVYSLRPEEKTELECSYLQANVAAGVGGALGAMPADAAEWDDELVYCDADFTPEDADAHGALSADLCRAPGDPLGALRVTEHCETSTGRFCFEMKFAGGPHLWFEQEPEVMADHCCAATGDGASAAECVFQPNNTLPFLMYEDISSQDSWRQAFFMVALCFGLYHVVSMVTLVANVQERAASTDATPTPLVPSILRSFKNMAFRPLLVAWAFDGLGLSALVTMFPFYIRYFIIPDGRKAQNHGTDMDPNECMAMSVFGLLVAAILSTPIWLLLAKYLGKYRAWLLYNMVNAFTNIMFIFLREGDPMMTIGLMAMNGIPVGGQFLINSILADVIDYDEFLNGVRNEGSFSVFATLIPKFVAIPASAIPLAIVNIIGFKSPENGRSQTQTDTVKMFIQMTFVLFPFVCVVMAFLIKIRFPIRLKSQNEEIADGIAKHAQGLPARDPLTGHMVKLDKLTAVEEEQAWLFENFSARDLEAMVATGTAAHIIKRIRSLVLSGAVCMVVCLGIVGAFFPYLEDRALSAVPIFAVIVLGGCTCFTVVNVLRLKDARKMEAFIVDHEYKAQFSGLATKVVASKRTGQRAGQSSVQIVDRSASVMAVLGLKSSTIAPQADPNGRLDSDGPSEAAVDPPRGPPPS